MTNFDRIKSMADAELAEFLKNIDCCPTEAFADCAHSESCRACWEAWLREEVAQDG